MSNYFNLDLQLNYIKARIFSATYICTLLSRYIPFYIQLFYLNLFWVYINESFKLIE